MPFNEWNVGIVAAADHMVKTWDVHTCTDLGPALTCSEAEALADVFEAGGHTEKADALMDAHRASDELGDDHYPMVVDA